MESSANNEALTSGKWKIYLLAFLAVITIPIILLMMSVLALRWIDPSLTSFTIREDWQTLEMERYSLRDYWVDSEEIPNQLEWAVVASEDQLFWEHRGFDVESIQEAWEDRQEGGRIRGASSISQQVAKNIFLSPAQSLFRKGLEAGITVLIEFFWPKERIIEVYLNIAEFGPGVFGVGRSAEVFWGIPVSQIDADKAARLAAVLPNPKRMRVEPPSPYTYERSRWILRQMSQLTGNQYVAPNEEEAEETGDTDREVNDPFLLETERELEVLLNTPADSISQKAN